MNAWSALTTVSNYVIIQQDHTIASATMAIDSTVITIHVQVSKPIILRVKF